MTETSNSKSNKETRTTNAVQATRNYSKYCHMRDI